MVLVFTVASTPSIKANAAIQELKNSAFPGKKGHYQVKVLAPGGRLGLQLPFQDRVAEVHSYCSWKECRLPQSLLSKDGSEIHGEKLGPDFVGALRFRGSPHGSPSGGKSRSRSRSRSRSSGLGGLQLRAGVGCVGKKAKMSPFLFTAEKLEQLRDKCHDDPAVMDLVGWYLNASEDVKEFSNLLIEEFEHYGLQTQ